MSVKKPSGSIDSKSFIYILLKPHTYYMYCSFFKKKIPG
jgi:hypothetical protein